MNTMNTTQYLAPGRFLDSDHANVIAFAKQNAGDTSDPRAAALRLYATVRDGIVYDPYVDLANPAYYRASGVLAAKQTFCIGKSRRPDSSAITAALTWRTYPACGARI